MCVDNTEQHKRDRYYVMTLPSVLRSFTEAFIDDMTVSEREEINSHER